MNKWFYSRATASLAVSVFMYFCKSLKGRLLVSERILFRSGFSEYWNVLGAKTGLIRFYALASFWRDPRASFFSLLTLCRRIVVVVALSKRICFTSVFSIWSLPVIACWAGKSLNLLLEGASTRSTIFVSKRKAGNRIINYWHAINTIVAVGVEIVWFKFVYLLIVRMAQMYLSFNISRSLS